MQVPFSQVSYCQLANFHCTRSWSILIRFNGSSASSRILDRFPPESSGMMLLLPTVCAVHGVGGVGGGGGRGQELPLQESYMEPLHTSRPDEL